MSEDYGSIDNIEVGKRIREIRESNGLTQEQLAEILKVTPNAVRAYEKGKYGLSREVMKLIRQYFHVTADFLLFGSEDSDNNLLFLVENASDEDKMKILIRLMVYFVSDKKRVYKKDEGWTATVDRFKELFGDMLE